MAEEWNATLETSEINVTLVLERTVNAEGGLTGPIGWDDVEDKPTTFPPSVHNHDDRYYTETEIDTALAGKAAASHSHDDRYYTETETDALLAAKAAASHSHDDRYYTETEIDTALAGKSDTSHTHDSRYYTETEIDTALALKLSISNLYAKNINYANNDYMLLTAPFGTAYSAGNISSTPSNSTNRAKAVPFFIEKDTPVDALAIYVVGTNSGASAVVRMGIYSDNNGRPGNVVVDAGSASINSSSMKTLTFSRTVLTPGFYWAIMGFQNLDTAGGNPTMAVGTTTATVGDPAPAATNNMFPYLTLDIGSGALTNNPTPTISRSLSSGAPHIWMRKVA